MKIVGTLTNYGRERVADKLLNGHNYTISKIAAGSGDTAMNAQFLSSHKQYLTMSSETIDGQTVYYGLLDMSAASENYTLTELGIYASYQTVNLFKLYKLSEPIEIDNSQNHTIRFVFKDADVVDALYDGYVMPESVVTYEILENRLAALWTPKDETVSFKVSGSELNGVIASIPDCVEKNYVITLTDAECTGITIAGKYGRGSITIKGRDGEHTAVTQFTRINTPFTVSDCQAKICFENIQFVCAADYSASLYITRCRDAELKRCVLGASKEADMVRVSGSTVQFTDCCISDSKGSGDLVYENSSHVRMSYDSSQMFDRSFILSGIAFLHVEGDSDVWFLGGLTESVVSNLMFFIKDSMVVTQTGSGTSANIKLY